MHQGAGIIMPNANTSKVHSKYWMLCSDEKTGRAVYDSCTKTFWGICWKAGQIPEACYKIKQHVYMPGNTRNENPSTVYFKMQSNVTKEQETRKLKLP
jgi:hypothetical protein